ncbi:copper resistance CopC family protein [Phaeobacter sp. NW0010-22]|uniref:copper resistance CopC family protein n=1 Tax=Phaeobacter sp. NW0010-22 TaxID=3135907 RepID=UPI0013DFA0FC
MKLLATFVLLSALATSAFAHSRVDSTTPENGAVLAEVPNNISFNFAADIRLTRVVMTYEDHPAARLDLGAQTSFKRVFTLPLEGIGAGSYRIEWRGLGEDGHAMQGDFMFTVD